MEQNYDFRKELLAIHSPGIRDDGFVPEKSLIQIDECYVIAVPEKSGRVLLTAALDLQSYLFESMGASVAVKRYSSLENIRRKHILVAVYSQLEETWLGAPIPASYCIRAGEDGVVVCGFDERGCAQGCYQLEDQMSRIRAPYLEPGEITYSPEFSPRMVHSGYGLDQYPDAHLSAIAHAGMDAILLFVKDVNRTPTGYQDFNELIYRAGKYGLDVYAYIYFESNMHPDDDGALAYYDSTYGRLFWECPGFRGIVLVGESVEFPSKDPRASKLKYYNNRIEGVCTGKPTAGWFPCDDYHQWVGMLQKVIGQYKPEADIVFWTYNWGSAPKEDRLKLIDSLPSGISLMATFEMFEQRVIDGVPVSTVDYTLSFVGPGAYFVSEAERAKERGIRLYAQANSAGLTWDFGVIPYEPCPMQWAKRYEAMLEAKKKYGLSGIMESHHYGFWPSFISNIEKMMFTSPRRSGEDAIRTAAQELYGRGNLDTALRAWNLLSKAIEYYPSTAEDQYGPFRIGPAYPMIFHRDVEIPTVPYAHFGGNAICFTDYASDALYGITSDGMKHTGLIQQRIPGEIRCLEKMRGLLQEARTLLEKIAENLIGIRQQDCRRLVNMIHFMENTVVTVIHVKQWNQRKWRLRTEEDSTRLAQLMEEMICIGREEIRNAEETIPLVEADSRLGWEPSMEYIGDAYHLRWKIRQTRQVIQEEIPPYLHIVQLPDQRN